MYNRDEYIHIWVAVKSKRGRKMMPQLKFEELDDCEDEEFEE